MATAKLLCTQNVTLKDGVGIFYYRIYLKFDLTSVNPKSINSATFSLYLDNNTSISSITPSVYVINGNNSWTEATAYTAFNSGGSVGITGWNVETWSIPSIYTDPNDKWYTSTITGDLTQGILKAFADGDTDITVFVGATTASASIYTETTLGSISTGPVGFAERIDAVYYPHILLDYVSGHNPVHSGTSGALLF